MRSGKMGFSLFAYFVFASPSLLSSIGVLTL